MKTATLKTIPIITLPFLLATLTGCAGQSSPRTTFDPCHRAQIHHPPIWTASAARTPEENQVILIGPERHSLLVYNLQGELEREIDLDGLTEFEYASPIRLQETDDGYLIGDKNKILWLDHDFKKRRMWKPFEHLKKAGIAAGTLSDFDVVGRTVYAFADFVWDDGAAPKPKTKKSKKTEKAELDPYDHKIPGTDKAPEGNWFRGFAKINLDEPDLVSLHRFGIDDEELNSYYFYSKRPYVANLGKQAYVLRYSDPPRLLRGSRKTELESLYTPRAEDDFQVSSVMTWKGRLFLRGYRRIETTRDGQSQVVKGPTIPTMIPASSSRAELLEMQQAKPEVSVQSLLIEVDPKTGDTLGIFRLPATQSSMKLIPGSHYWVMIEESAVPNINPDDKVQLTLLPSSWLDRRRGAGASEVILECPVG